jgi:hypothetical protein
MPNLPPFSIVSPTLDAAEVYSGIYQPANPPTSLEILNGGMDEDNLGTGVKADAWTCEPGAFTTGFSDGFERWEFAYARQFSSGNNGSQHADRLVSSGWTLRRFLPWPAKLLFVSYEGWITHDATFWDPEEGASLYERWDMRVRVNGTEMTELYAVLPIGRVDTGTPSAPVSTDMHDESRWRFVNKMGLVENVPRGRLSLDVSVYANIYAPDPRRAKWIAREGRVTVFAIR